jgi:hypothetical protein
MLLLPVAPLGGSGTTLPVIAEQASVVAVTMPPP